MPSMSAETLAYMRQCEAREWIARYRRKIGEQGLDNARLWWMKVCDDIARIRGQQALDELREQIRKEK